MIGKLIVLGIVVVALIVFVPQVSKILLGDSRIQTMKEKIDNATANIVDNPNPIVTNSSSSANNTRAIPYQVEPTTNTNQVFTGQVFQKSGSTCQISVPGMAQTINGQKEITHIIQMGNCSFDLGQPVQVTATTNPGTSTNNTAIQVVPYASSSDQGTVPGNSVIEASASEYPTLPQYYKFITLNAENKGNMVMITYDDNTGKTTSVTVTLRNTDTQIFSGQFFSSQFQTQVKDLPETPHMIDMSIENSEYGTLHGSVYAPSEIQNSTITGIFNGS